MSSPDSFKPKKGVEEEEIVEETMLPYDAYWSELEGFKKRDPKNMYALLIRGILIRGDDYEEELRFEEEEYDPSEFTAEEMCTIRHVFITKKRQDLLDEMEQYVVGDQANHSVMMFGTSFGYDILDGFNLYKATSWKELTSLADRFDSLFAYTFNLNEYNVWMHDNEGGMDGMVKDLAKMWNSLLKNSDETLEIDGEYTRHGVMQLLNDFKKEVEKCYSDPPFKFDIEENQWNAKADAHNQRFLDEFGDYVLPFER